MADWKGTLCIITIFTRGEKPELVDSKRVFMDTDTMSDIFSKYDLLKHEVIINPYTKEAK